MIKKILNEYLSYCYIWLVKLTKPSTISQVMNLKDKNIVLFSGIIFNWF